MGLIACMVLLTFIFFLRRWIPTPVPDEQCFESMKAGMDKLPPGVKMVLNSGTYPSVTLPLVLGTDMMWLAICSTAEFYGFNPPEANLELIARFFEKYPEYVEKAFLVVKVCLGSSPSGSQYLTTGMSIGVGISTSYSRAE